MDSRFSVTPVPIADLSRPVELRDFDGIAMIEVVDGKHVISNLQDNRSTGEE